MLNGAIQKPDLYDYYMYLKDEYYNMTDQGREFHPAEVFGYVGSGYWLLCDKVNFFVNFEDVVLTSAF